MSSLQSGREKHAILVISLQAWQIIHQLFEYRFHVTSAEVTKDGLRLIIMVGLPYALLEEEAAIMGLEQPMPTLSKC